MTRMVRKQVYITPEDDELLKRRARELEVTESEVIRRAIEQAVRTADKRQRDIRAWEESVAFMRSRAKLPIAGIGGDRGWTREELYDERPKYLSR
jgi:predicted ATP-grasp superfamily ATP-dependent carboligase